MSKKYLLSASAKRFTTEVVGEQYHQIERTLHDLAAAKGGTCELEFALIPEPDNPYDDHAISVRYNNKVAGYIPRSRNRGLWSDITRVQASGYTPTIRGQVEAWSNGKSASITLAVGGNSNLISSEAGLKPKRKGGYTPPPAYAASTTSNGPYTSSNSYIDHSKYGFVDDTKVSWVRSKYGGWEPPKTAVPDDDRKKRIPEWAKLLVAFLVVLAITLVAVCEKAFFLTAMEVVLSLVVVVVVSLIVWAFKSQK